MSTPAYFRLCFLTRSVYDKIDMVDELVITDTINKLDGNTAFTVTDKTKGFDFEVMVDVSDRLKGVLKDGGLLNHTKKNG